MRRWGRLLFSIVVAIIAFVELERVMERGADGQRFSPYVGHRSYYGRFYPAHGSYLWTRDCNWWTVERLRAAGLAGSSAGVGVLGAGRRPAARIRP